MHPSLYSKILQFISQLDTTSSIFKNLWIYFSNDINGKASLMEWDSAMCSASLALRDVSVCSSDADVQNRGHPMCLITKPVLERTYVASDDFKESYFPEKFASANISILLLLSGIIVISLKT